MYLGMNTGSTGNYQLSGGSLSSGYQYVGYQGTGSFTQSGGNNSVIWSGTGWNDGQLYLGYYSGSSGTYSLSNGQLTTYATNVGYNPGYTCTGTFNQSGGTHTVNYLTVGSASSYQLTGGTLQVNNSFDLLGTLNFGSGTGTISAKESSTPAAGFMADQYRADRPNDDRHRPGFGRGDESWCRRLGRPPPARHRRLLLDAFYSTPKSLMLGDDDARTPCGDEPLGAGVGHHVSGVGRVRPAEPKPDAKDASIHGGQQCPNPRLCACLRGRIGLLGYRWRRRNGQDRVQQNGRRTAALTPGRNETGGQAAPTAKGQRFTDAGDLSGRGDAVSFPAGCRVRSTGSSRGKAALSRR